MDTMRRMFSKEQIENMSQGGSGSVKSVNLIDPDAEGDVTVTASDIPTTEAGVMVQDVLDYAVPVDAANDLTALSSHYLFGKQTGASLEAKLYRTVTTPANGQLTQYDNNGRLKSNDPSTGKEVANYEWCENRYVPISADLTTAPPSYFYGVDGIGDPCKILASTVGGKVYRHDLTIYDRNTMEKLIISVYSGYYTQYTKGSIFGPNSYQYIPDIGIAYYEDLTCVSPVAYFKVGTTQINVEAIGVEWIDESNPSFYHINKMFESSSVNFSDTVTEV